MNKINRRDFLSLVVSETKKPFSDSTFSVEFQGVTSYINKNINNKNNVMFIEENILGLPNIKGLSTVSFSVWPHKKTDNFFTDFLKEKKLTPLERYAITTNIPEKSLDFWDKIVWITAEIPDKLPEINCPILILQDIENFNSTNTPADLLSQLPPESDIFIAQHLDLSDKNNPAMKRVYDFLNVQP
jgi:hypothetical protein